MFHNPLVSIFLSLGGSRTCSFHFVPFARSNFKSSLHTPLATIHMAAICHLGAMLLQLHSSCHLHCQTPSFVASTSISLWLLLWDTLLPADLSLLHLIDGPLVAVVKGAATTLLNKFRNNSLLPS